MLYVPRDKFYVYEIWSTHENANKTYIGKSWNPENRFKSHKKATNLNLHLTRAIKKYGKETFKLEILDCTLDESNAYRLEHETMEDRGRENLWNTDYGRTSDGGPKQHEDVRKRRSVTAKKTHNTKKVKLKHSQAVKKLLNENTEYRKIHKEFIDKGQDTFTKKRAMIRELILASEIELLVDQNPKRKGSDTRKRFDLYFSSTIKTGRDYVEAGGTYEDLRFDLNQKFVGIVSLTFSEIKRIL